MAENNVIENFNAEGFTGGLEFSGDFNILFAGSDTTGPCALGACLSHRR